MIRKVREDTRMSEDELGAWVFIAMLLIVPTWRIVRRTGRHPALSLLLFLPFIGFVILSLLLAFGPWPVLQRSANPLRS